MKYFIIFLTATFCSTVGEFALDNFNSTDLVRNGTDSEEPFMDSSDMEVDDVSVDSLSEHRANTPQINQVFPSETSPIFKVIRNFLFQARDGFLEPLETITEGPIDEKTEHIIRFLEHGLIEATTVLINQMENVAMPTMSSNTVERDLSISKRVGDVSPEIIKERINMNAFGNKNKRQTAFDMISNMSTSCSNCYDNLQTCVQQCFVRHNCNDIQRNVRSCPPTPGRLCNPFTPWNPVDECKSNDECKSPFLCCNDGCINKCVSGVWRS